MNEFTFAAFSSNFQNGASARSFDTIRHHLTHSFSLRNLLGRVRQEHTIFIGKKCKIENHFTFAVGGHLLMLSPETFNGKY